MSSKDNDEECVIQSRSDNIELTIHDQEDIKLEIFLDIKLVSKH